MSDSDFGEKVSMSIVQLPQPLTGGVLLSYHCCARCRHCMYGCSPQWPTDWISQENLEVGLSQLSGRILSSPWGANRVSLNHGLHFTGGEPFLNFKLLLKAVEIAHACEIPSLFVETNAFWCKDEKSTKDRLERLKNAGLNGIMISVNPFYAEFIPFAYTQRCVDMSTSVFGPNVMIYQWEYFHLFRDLGLTGRVTLEELAERTQHEDLPRHTEMFLMGRATQSLRAFLPAYPAHAFFRAPCRPPFLRNWHNHFDNYGNLVPGYCGGLSLGSWFHLNEILEHGIDLSERPVLAKIIDNDFEGLFGLAVKSGYLASEQGYVSKCDLCLDLRRHLARVGSYSELSPREFYALED